MSRWVLLILLWVGLCTHTQATLTLDAALEQTLANNYAIQIAHTQAARAQTQTGLSQANLLPTITVRQTETHQPAITPGISTQTNQTTQTTGTIQQTLFAGLTGITQWRKNKSLADLTQLQAEQVLETTLYTTTLAFYDLVETQYRLAVAESVVALSEDRLNRVRIRADLGGESQLAVLNATVDLNTDKTEFQNALAARKSAEIQLNQQLNQALDTPLTAELPAPLSVPTSGIRQNRAIRIAEQSHRLSQLDKQLVLGALFPSVTVRHTMQDTREPINTLEAQLSFTGWRHKQVWDAAKLTHAETNLNRARVRQLVQAQWAQALVDYDRTRTLQAHELETVRVAKRNFDRTQALFHAGQVSALVFRDAQLKYTQSQYRAHQAQIQLGKAIARVHQLAGG
jgi:outer membrane protein TolC